MRYKNNKGGGESLMLENKLYFKDHTHKNCYEEVLSQMKDPDVFSRIAVFLLTSSPDTRDYFYDIYDPDRKQVRSGCWNEPWITPKSKLLIAAALSLTGSLDAPMAACGTLWPVIMSAYECVDQLECVI